MFSLENKTALVTGGSRGIGRSIALRMAEAGANVIVSSRKREACDAVVEKIMAAGGKAVAVPSNISDLSSLEQLAESAQQAFGNVDISGG